jgi:hypothetical protein
LHENAGKNGTVHALCCGAGGDAPVAGDQVTDQRKRAARRLDLLRVLSLMRREHGPASEEAQRYERKLRELDEFTGYTRTSRGNAPPRQRGQFAGDRRSRAAELDAAIERRRAARGAS